VNRYARVGTAAVLLAAGLLLPATPAAAAPPGFPDCGKAITDQLDHTPWPLRRLQPSQAWPLSRGAGVTVAVIDSGLSTTHPKLAGQLLPGVDLVPPGENGQCDNSHGTLVASIIAGRDTRDAPFSGVAPDARILPIRVVPNDQTSNSPELPTRIANAIRYAVDHGAKVINLSLYTVPTQAVAEAVQYAIHSNVVVVAASGNTGGSQNGSNPVYPAAYDGVLAVGGTDENDHHVSQSTSGDYVNIAAPGVNIEGPAPRGGGYGRDAAGGTSFAAAYVSGVAALIRSYNPTLPAFNVIRRLEETADAPPEGRNNDVGFGVVNPYRAVSTIFDPRANPTPAYTGQLPDPRSESDPVALAKRVAAWVVPGGLLLTVVLLSARGIAARGRRRGWRPGPIR